MSQNYNVDDILEEVRRKKARQQGAPATYDTYEAPRQPWQGDPSSRRRQEETPVTPKRSRRTVDAQPPPRPQRAQPRATGYREAKLDENGWDLPDPASEKAETPIRRAPSRPQPSQPGIRGGASQARSKREPLPPVTPPRRTVSVDAYDVPDYTEPPRRQRPRTPMPDVQSQRPVDYEQTPPSSSRAAGWRQAAPRGTPQRPVYEEESRYMPPASGRYGDDFLSEAPKEPDTEDFSLHFSLDGDTQEQPAYRDEAPQEDGAYEGYGDYETYADDAGEPLVKSRWHQSFLEQEMREQPVPDDDFAAPADTPYVEKDLKKLQTGLIVRTVSVGILTIFSIYLAFSIKYPPFGKLIGFTDPMDRLNLPTEWIFPDKHPRIFLSVNLIICVAAALICANIIAAGFGALFRLRSNSDTPAALAVLSVLVQGIVLMIYPSQLAAEGISLYIPVAMLILLFTLFGKLMLAGRIWRNFHFLTEDKEKYALLSIQNKDFAREFSRGLGPEVDQVAYSAKAAFISGFLSKSYSGDYSDNFYCVSAPVSLAGALLVGGVTAFLAKDPVLAVSAFAAAVCVCAPLSSGIVPHLMLGRMSKWLCKRGAMLAGYETAEEIAQTGAVVIDEKDLFPTDSVQLHGMKVFAEKRIDEAILDAASVILSCNGLMSGVFLNMIGGNQKLLKKVDGLIYEDGMGVSAWVDGKRVLIGSRELMQNHEVECPSRDFESRYTRGGRRVLYIANSGELSAMFVVSYNGETRVGERLMDLERRGVSMILYTTDPNLTNELVAHVFGLRKGSIRILPAKLHTEYNYLTRYREQVTCGCAHEGGLPGILQLLRASASVCHSVRTGAVVQLIGIITGYGLMVAFAFTNSLSVASFYMILLYGLCAFGVTFLVSNFGKM